MGVLRKKHKKKSRRPSFKSVLTSILATQAAIFLLLLAGVSLAGTAVAFIASMPLFVVFSPILVPAGVATGLLATGLAAAGSSGAMAVSLILWVFKRVTGKEPPKIMSKVLKKVFPGGGAAAKLAAKPEAEPAAAPAAAPSAAPAAAPST
ncbi:PREDICTED: oleosin-B1-like [Brassica oleracea var. oleracea]|uniref:Oleosin n=1 Tax=Brassica oleracea var. oleracea TaxID=109376 RepID=A0A0D3AI36_BRAOL|nr:PREDICTED: oleosin-B1-like [Brassica oleracea var. oleracea]